uniref:Uncharacterized protein n=1 Tax=Arundo donax TaxID=35708 RepID=A0A0A9B3B3_ARUDO
MPYPCHIQKWFRNYQYSSSYSSQQTMPTEM